MSKFLTVTALLCCLTFSNFVNARPTNEPQPSISVSGNGKIVYVPNIGYIHFGVTSEAWEAADAWKKNEGVVKKMFAALKKLGVAEKDLKTGNISIQPLYRHLKDQEPEFLGYSVSYTLSVTVRKLGQMGDMLSAMVAAGANRNLSISFGYTEMEKLIEEARTKAVTEARKKAQLYVTGAGARLGDVLSISDSSSAYHYRQLPIDIEMVKAGSANIPVAAGEQEVTATVSVKWAIDNRKPASVIPWDMPSRKDA